jgi:RNA polymerase-binding transcription factor DksA
VSTLKTCANTKCGRLIAAARLERHPDATLCASCATRIQRATAGHVPVDDIRHKRAGLPEALRRAEDLYNDD